ncbi:MAG TPA: hypothetical protein VEZ90_07165 [Blastocatellia bacterium]|nr:hypothetical protein [Blastocatellia bacterium]
MSEVEAADYQPFEAFPVPAAPEAVLTVTRDEMMVNAASLLAFSKGDMSVNAVLIAASSGLSLVVESSGLKARIRMTTSTIRVTEPVRVSVGLRHLLRTLGALSRGAIKVQVSQCSIHLSDGAAEFRLSGSKAKNIQLPGYPPRLSVQADLIAPLIRWASNAARNADESRKGRVFLVGSGGTLEILGTDGHRLHFASVKTPVSESFCLALDGAMASLLADACRGREGLIHFGGGDRWMTIEVGNSYLCVECDSEAPFDFHPEIEKAPAWSTPLQLSELRSIARSAVVSGAAALTIYPDHGRLRFSSEAVLGYRRYISSDWLPDGAEVTFNARYVLEALACLPRTGFVTYSHPADSSLPLTISAEEIVGGRNVNFTAAIMPVAPV